MNITVMRAKKILKIPGADHNTIFYYGMNEYMNSVKDLLQVLIHNK